MKQPIVTAGLLALGLSLVAVPTVASETQDRFREEGKEMDLTGFFQADTDAYSRSFLFGGVNEHDFSVEQAGTYRFTSDVTAGYSNDYRIAAVLLDSQGREIARSRRWDRMVDCNSRRNWSRGTMCCASRVSASVPGQGRGCLFHPGGWAGRPGAAYRESCRRRRQYPVRRREPDGGQIGVRARRRCRGHGARV